MLKTNEIILFKKGCRVLYYGAKQKLGHNQEAMTAEEKTAFNKIIERYVNNILDLRKRTVVSLRLGVDGFEPFTYQKIGDLLGVSRTRVSQLEQRAFQELFRSIKPDWRKWIWD